MTRTNRNKMRKFVLLMCSAVLLVCVSIGATVAYLTSQDTVTNSFTVGNVSITLDEAKVSTDGTPAVNGGRVKANNYHLIPGRTYTKDPTVHVGSSSEDCWLFVKLENGISGIEKEGTTTIAAQMAANGWTLLQGKNNVYAYRSTVSKGTDVSVFGSFTIDDSANVSSYANKSIVVTAYAVQADGFSTAAAAWDAAKF